MFPPIPPWSGLHPLIVHFPIALAFVAPLFAILALLGARQRQAFAVVTLVLLVIAAGGALLATATGDAAGELAERGPAVNAALELHEHRAELARNVLVLVTVLYGAMLAALKLFGAKLPAAAHYAPHAVAVLATVACALLVARAAHEGGQLVHVHGVRAMIGSPAANPATAAAAISATTSAATSAATAVPEKKGRDDDGD